MGKVCGVGEGEGRMSPLFWNKKGALGKCEHPILSCPYSAPQESMVGPGVRQVFVFFINPSSPPGQQEVPGVAGETQIPGLVSSFIFVGELKARAQTDDERARNL